MSRLARVIGVLGVLVSIVVLAVVHGAPVQAPVPRGAAADAAPAPAQEWNQVFFDGFDGPAGEAPDQWHTMLPANGAVVDGQGRLDVGHLSQIRSHIGWTFPVGTRVRATVSVIMPDTGSNYAAFWIQHPNGIDPREIDVIESYGPLKPAGAQVGSHICYDDTPETAVHACDETGRSAELLPVTQAFGEGSAPWDTYWQYAAEFTIGGDTVTFSAADEQGTLAYSLASTPDARRVPSPTVPFHLRLSNKDVEAQYAVPGGERHSMFVDWVRLDVKYP